MAAYADLIMVLGIILLALSFLVLVNTFSSQGRSFKRPIAMLVLGGGMMGYANASTPKGYSLEELPMLFVTVFTGG